jgi:ABC-type glycerol-3-phosphate transport system substrate-binding protein
MKVALSALVLAALLGGIAGGAPQSKPQEKPQEQASDKPKEVFDPFADPREEMLRRAAEAAKEKKFNELKVAAEELAELSQKMSEEIAAGGKDVISARIFQNLDRAEKLVKTMRDKAR